MESSDVREWFDAYLDAFAACGRADHDELDGLLEFYDVPLLLTTDERVSMLGTRADVLRAVQRQVDGMRAADYARSDVLESHVEVLNHVSAIFRGHFSRRRRDGGEIGTLRATYVITDGLPGRRISALIVHSP